MTVNVQVLTPEALKSETVSVSFWIGFEYRVPYGTVCVVPRAADAMLTVGDAIVFLSKK
jgi:hypothetical protein